MKSGKWILSAKRFFLYFGFLLVLVSPALVGIIPDKFASIYIAICVFAVLFGCIKGAIQAEIMLLLSMLCLCLVFADLALRIFGASYIYPRPEDRFTNRWPKMPALSRFQPNVRFEGDVFGDLSGLIGSRELQERRHVSFVTDSHGFRNTSRSTEGAYDVIAVGDSVGAGMNASQDIIWTEQLRSVYGHRVVNLSTGGCPWDYYMNIVSEISRLKTDSRTQLIFVVSASNDLLGHYASTNPSYETKLSQGLISYETFRNRSPVKLIMSRFVYLLRSRSQKPDAVVVRDFIGGKKMLFLKEFAENQKITYEQVLKHENYEHLSDIFSELGKLSADKNIRVLVVVVPPKEDVYSWVYGGGEPWSSDRSVTGLSLAIEKLCEAQGFSFWDAKSYLIDESRSVFEHSAQTLWWYDDSHWNTAGHTVFARGLEKFLNKAD